VTAGDVAIVTLATDFGTRDTYVAEMKAAVLAVVRTVHLVDLTHDLEPQDVLGGALALERAARAFPPGTIHLAVVDPGVGTARRGLVLGCGRPSTGRRRSVEPSTAATSSPPLPGISPSGSPRRASARRSPTRCACRGPEPIESRTASRGRSCTWTASATW
jgi:hypothetical protein